MKKKIVFISYCRNDIKVQWLNKLISTLEKCEVIVDINSLQYGQDLPFFMEKIKKADKVLMLLGKEYKEKANDRRGGVGTETQIISCDVYNDVEQTKFIPIVVSKDENGNPYLPYYLQSRYYADFSDDSLFDDNIETLIKQIHNSSVNDNLEMKKLSKPVVKNKKKKKKILKIIIAFLILLIVITLINYIYGKKVENDIQQKIYAKFSEDNKEAMFEVENLNFDKAIEIYNDVLNYLTEPENILEVKIQISLCYLGQGFIEQGEKRVYYFDKAVLLLKELLLMDTDFSEEQLFDIRYNFAFACIYGELQEEYYVELKDTINKIEKSIKEKGNYAVFSNNIADVFLVLGMFYNLEFEKEYKIEYLEEAISYYRNALNLQTIGTKIRILSK